MYKDETERHWLIQHGIDCDRDFSCYSEVMNFTYSKEGMVRLRPWREVDNRKAYMEKRMRMEGLE